MALNARFAVAAQNAGADAITALIGASGFLDFYDGTQPTNPDTAIGAQVKLAHLALTADAFADAVAGTATANAITGAAAIASGTCTWATLTTSAGTRIMDLSVGTANANIVVASTTFTSGVTVNVTSMTFSIPMQGT